MRNKFFFYLLKNGSNGHLKLLLTLVMVVISQACQTPNEPQTTAVISTPISVPSNTQESQFDRLTQTPRLIPFLAQTPIPPSPTVRPSPTANFSWPGYIALIAGDVSTQQQLPYLYKTGDDLTLLQQDALTYPPNMAWTPDGKSLILSSFVENSGWELYLFSLKTFEIRKFETGLEGIVGFGDAVWSPNGQYLAFTQDMVVDHHRTIYLFVRQMETGEVHFVTEGSSPAWLPDNETLLFRRTHLDEQVPLGDIFRIRMDGTGLMQLTENVYAEAPQVSPDGRVVVFAAYLSPNFSERKYGLFSIQPDGSGWTVLANRLYGHVSWSPDGRYLLMAKDCKIYLMEWRIDTVTYRDILPLPEGYCYYYASLQPGANP